MHRKFGLKASREGVSSQTYHGCDNSIKIDLNLILLET